MGVSCGILDDKFDRLYRDAEYFFEYRKVFDFHLLTLEEIDKKLIKTQKYRNKYSKIKTKDFKKKNKIILVDSFLNCKTIELENAKEIKLMRLALDKQVMAYKQNLRLHLLELISNLDTVYD